jgi:hypothetical protein
MLYILLLLFFLIMFFCRRVRNLIYIQWSLFGFVCFACACFFFFIYQLDDYERYLFSLSDRLFFKSKDEILLHFPWEKLYTVSIWLPSSMLKRVIVSLDFSKVNNMDDIDDMDEFEDIFEYLDYLTDCLYASKPFGYILSFLLFGLPIIMFILLELDLIDPYHPYFYVLEVLLGDYEEEGRSRNPPNRR